MLNFTISCRSVQYEEIFFSIIQEMFDAVFGANAGIPATNDTRWNSVLRQVNCILEKGMARLNSVLEMLIAMNVSLVPKSGIS